MTSHKQLTEQIIGAAIEVHRELGPGLLEPAYETALCHELSLRKVPFRRQVRLPLRYKGVLLDCDFRMDIVAAETVVVELKSVEWMHSVFEAQLLTHLKLSNLKIGLLINFNVPVLKDGIKRMVNGYVEEASA